MRRESVLLLLFCACASVRAQEREAALHKEALRQILKDFVAFGFPDIADEQISLSGPTEGLLGQPVYCLRAVASSTSGQPWNIALEVHATRMYVTMYSAHPKDTVTDNTETPLDAGAVRRIAREFAQSRFPTWSDELEVTWVAEPLPRSAGGVPRYSFRWTGRRDAVETGDWVVVSVSRSGELLHYLCNAAVHHARVEVTMPKSQAVAKVREMIRERASFGLDQVTFAAKLVLSCPFAPNEGPVWVVTATRPRPAEGAGEPRLRRFIDAVTKQFVDPPWYDTSDDSWFFHAGL